MNQNGKRIGLALSGGGYRAAAYHIGTLRALHKMGILDKVNVISSVSGGSITAAYYALHKDNFEEFETSFINKLQIGVLHLAALNVLAILVVLGALTCYFGWIGLLLGLVVLFFIHYWVLPLSLWIRWQYDWLFFKWAKLKDLPETPSVKLCSTDIATGRLFVCSKEELYGYDYKYIKKIKFKQQLFPVSRAVMASSCVPFAFSPVRIPCEFFEDQTKVKDGPLLIDGGLYDNQGAYKLQEKDSDYQCSQIIVSDAGNTEMSKRWALNIILLLLKTSDILMRRIRAMQIQQNLYSSDKSHQFAYTSLLWNPEWDWVNSLARNIKDGNVHEIVLRYHGISDDVISLLKKDSTWNEGKEKLHDCLNKSIGWDEIIARKPSPAIWKSAKGVGTNLIRLRENKILDLIAVSEWMTELQIKTYLPNLL